MISETMQLAGLLYLQKKMTKLLIMLVSNS